MGVDPVSLAVIGSAALSAAGSVTQGQAAAKAASYNAAVASNNAKIATQNATFAGEEGSANANASAMNSAQKVAAIETAQAGNGINVNTGSAVNVRASEAELGELNSMNIRANAARQAYGYLSQASGYEAQHNLDRSQIKGDELSGVIKGGASLLNGAGNAGQNFNSFQAGNGALTAGDEQFLNQVHGNG